MHVTIVDVLVKSEFVEDFIEACQLNHQASIQEPGNRRFDILQCSENPQQFVLYEAYDNEQAAANHKQTQHYLSWRESVADWMERPRTGVNYKGLFPQ